MKVAVIGGGYAGFACAVPLAGAGVRVTVFEAGRVLGGRARRVTMDGMVVDNGAHLLMGAYRELLGLMHIVGVAEDRAFLRLPLRLEIAGELSLRAPSLPAPLHLFAALLGARGLSMSERLSAVAFQRAVAQCGFRARDGETAAAFIARHEHARRVAELLWNPIVTAALNTPPERACAQIFVNVLRDTLHRSRTDSDFLLPRIDLSALFPEPAADYVSAHGGEVRAGVRVRRVAPDAAGIGVDKEIFSHVVVATSPWHAARLLEPLPDARPLVDMLGAMPSQPITTAYLRYPAGVRCDSPLTGLGRNAEPWVFDRGHTHGAPGLMGVTYSAWRPAGEANVVAQQADRLLRQRLLPGLPAPEWARVIVEKRATWSCDAGLRRPGVATPVRRVWLAGDYTDPDYPATLEAAVRSGLQCARSILTDA